MYLQNLQYLLVEAVIVGLDIVMLLVDKKATHICVSFAHMDTHMLLFWLLQWFPTRSRTYRFMIFSFIRATEHEPRWQTGCDSVRHQLQNLSGLTPCCHSQMAAWIGRTSEERLFVYSRVTLQIPIVKSMWAWRAVITFPKLNGLNRIVYKVKRLN